jgi:hypothetical protein
MKLHITCLISVILISFPNYCMDFASQFLRINPSDNTSEHLIRHYTSPDGKLSIQLIAMSHIALPSFYRQVENRITKTLVAYESVGQTIEELAEYNNKFIQLGLPHSLWYERVFGRPHEKPDALGRVSQEVLSYKNAQELIHADTADPEWKSHEVLEVMQNDDVWLRNKVESLIHGRMEMAGIKLAEGEGIEHKINELRLWQPNNKNAHELSIAEINAVLEVQEESPLIRQGLFPAQLSGDELKDWQFKKVTRSEYIFASLNKIFQRATIPNKVSVVYGAGHMCEVENFLLRSGFSADLKKDEWLIVSYLEPKSLEEFAPEKLQAQYQQSLPPVIHDQRDDNKAFPNEKRTFLNKKTLKSPNGHRSIHLFGSRYPISSTTGDEQFIKNTREEEYWLSLSKTQKELLASLQENDPELRTMASNSISMALQEKSTELCYTPYNLKQVQEDLIAAGFVLSNEVFSINPDPHHVKFSEATLIFSVAAPNDDR